MGWEQFNEVKTRRVLAGICVRCGNKLAREGKLTCRSCGLRESREGKAWHARMRGCKPSKRRCGICRKRGHDQRLCPKSDAERLV